MSMQLPTWDVIIIAIFFFYGLAFYSMGLALLVESVRASELGLARSMRLLAGFGLLHGIHEWFDMVEQSVWVHYQTTMWLWMLWARLAILVTSFVALLMFGEHLLARTQNRPTRWRATMAALVLYTLSCIAVRFIYSLDEAAWLEGCDVLSRYILGAPSGVMACWALLQQRTAFRERGMDRFVRDLTIAAVALAFYGIIGQLIPRASAIFPSMFINSELFLQITGFPIQLFRTAMACIVAVSMIRVLRALEVESQQRLEASERARSQTEELSREQLARLNAELQSANEQTSRLLSEVQQRDALRGEFLQRVTSAQENERQRIARELHDGTGQALTGVALGLRGLAAQYKSDNQHLAQRLSLLETMATESVGELRRLINDLRPPQLDDMGLVAALRWLSERFRDQPKPLVRFNVRGESRPLPPEVETTLFRIAQEGLTNALKYAQADHIWITLNYTAGAALSIRDDGIGFDPNAAQPSHRLRTAWGLVGIRERCLLINAELKVESQPGAGSHLLVTLNDVDTRMMQDANQSVDR